MDKQINQFLDRTSNFLGRRPGLLPLVVIVLILVNFILQIFPGSDVWLAGSNLFLHAGLITAIIGLHWLNETINVMTLGGLALAVGILVDDATVMIENIDRHLVMGKPLEQAIIDAANQIVVPTLVATLCIAIVWIPLFELGGVAGYLFKPMAEAVIIAMLASFVLSRTLVPTMAKYMMKDHHVAAT